MTFNHNWQDEFVYEMSYFRITFTPMIIEYPLDMLRISIVSCLLEHAYSTIFWYDLKKISRNSKFNLLKLFLSIERCNNMLIMHVIYIVINAN